MESVLSVSGIKKTYELSKRQQKIERTSEKRKQALKGVDFEAYRGEIFGLLGPNGAGKTTMLRIISTLIKADAGEVFVEGHSVTKEPEQVRRSIGFLTSELKLEEFFTPNYLYDFFSDLYEIPKEKRESRKKMMFEKFGIDKFAEVKVANLSTGMKQKISLVISLVHDPNIVIFDEPTNGLDVLTAKTVTDFLLDLRKQNKTVIISTHIFSLVEKVCDRAGVILDGQMKVCGSLEEVTQGRSLEERFFEIYEETAGEENEA